MTTIIPHKIEGNVRNDAIRYITKNASTVKVLDEQTITFQTLKLLLFILLFNFVGIYPCKSVFRMGIDYFRLIKLYKENHS